MEIQYWKMAGENQYVLTVVRVFAEGIPLGVHSNITYNWLCPTVQLSDNRGSYGVILYLYIPADDTG